MLCTTSRSFIKNNDIKLESSEGFESPTNKSTNSKLIYKGSSFKPKGVVIKGNNELFTDNYLVSSKFSSTTKVNTFTYPPLRKTESQFLESEMAASTDISSDAESNESFGKVASPISTNNTFKKFLQIQNDKQNNFTSSNNQDSSIDSTKKKTRRGGKKARLRREREKGKVILFEDVQQKSEGSTPKQKIKYKTEMCKNWVETGKCSYSVRCMFAHGYHQLSSSQAKEPAKISYKKTLCEKFHKESYCSYGSRCVYIHDERSLDVLPHSYYGKGLISLPDVWNNPLISSRRLPIFSEIMRKTDENRS
mmetsp:Transcript_3254/g.2718  ORF Transcript_3254/g.2718 Transcript_3254/m.2718 type:complete len:307 (+) Transcript_3254:3-923(+)